MRLLERKSDGELSLTQEFVKHIPAYAILSHSWGDDDQEVSFDDMKRGLGRFKEGYQKIKFCGDQAARDGLQYFWVDTCCIKKSDPIELQKSINSMFSWYQDAKKCYVFLSDVGIPHHNPFFGSVFPDARWFTRGWTLQELLAPSSVEFFSADYKRLGDKHSLELLIHKRTRIPVEALRKYDPTQFSVDERLLWVAKRQTKHEEDMAYSLLGLFGVFLSPIYGEGKENAFRRLREEIIKRVGSDKSEKFPSAGNQPKFTVPFARDPKFIGRGNIMKEITNRLQNQRSIALCGIGGIGQVFHSQ
jgi:Heterokaryon incompatibility protein (HET)